MGQTQNLTIESRLRYQFKLYKIRKEIEIKRKVSFGELYNDIAEYCGINPTTVRKYNTSNDEFPSLRVAIKLAEYFGVRVDELFLVEGGSGYKSI